MFPIPINPILPSTREKLEMSRRVEKINRVIQCTMLSQSNAGRIKKGQVVTLHHAFTCAPREQQPQSIFSDFQLTAQVSEWLRSQT